jgi:hypothetical protein
VIDEHGEAEDPEHDADPRQRQEEEPAGHPVGQVDLEGAEAQGGEGRVLDFEGRFWGPLFLDRQKSGPDLWSRW